MKLERHVQWVLATLAMTACLGGSDEPRVDSESHFLTICSIEGDCAAGKVCACGICTERCSSDPASCDGTCAPSSAFGSGCESAEPSESLCTYECTSDDDCSGEGFVCNAAEQVCVLGLPSELQLGGTGPVWRRCSGGQSWSGTACIGTPERVSRDVAAERCGAMEGDYRLPTHLEVEALLGSCELYDVNEPRMKMCSACQDSATCMPLMVGVVPVSDYDEWLEDVWYEGSAAWSYRPYVGMIAGSYHWTPLGYRCVRDAN